MLLDEVERRHAKPAIDTYATPYVQANVKNISRIQMNSKPIYKIFVSSTFKDLEEERIKVMTTIVNCGHLPIGMEQFPAAPITAWNYIKLLYNYHTSAQLFLRGAGSAKEYYYERVYYSRWTYFERIRSITSD